MSTFDAQAFAIPGVLQSTPLASAHVVLEPLALLVLATVKWVQPRYPALAWEARTRITQCLTQAGSCRAGPGMAIGTGSGLAHAAIDRVFSSKHPEPQEAQQAAQQIAAAPSVRRCHCAAE